MAPSRRSSLSEALRRRSRYAVPASLGQPAHCVHCRGSQPNQELSSTEQCQGFLLLDRAVRDRPKNLRVETSVTSQLLRIHIVALAVAVRDRSQLTYVPCADR